MDKISPMLHKIVVGGDKPSEISFHDWRKKVDKYEGKGFEELKKIISSANWFDELKNLRDDYVVHHGFSVHSIGVVGNQLGFHLHSHIKEKDVFLRTSFNFLES